MTTEAVLLLVISVLILGSVYFTQDNSPKDVFRNAGPHLGGKIERSLSSGHHFFDESGSRPEWTESN